MTIVKIDSLPQCAAAYVSDWTIIVVDVIRFTTTVATALSIERDVYPARSTDSAFATARQLKDALLAGELGGNVPYGFDLANSPVQIMALQQVPCGFFTSAERPIVLISSSGSQLLMNSVEADDVYLGCLRNLTSLTEYVSGRHNKIAVLGAGTRGQFRREDQLGCAWIASRLAAKGFKFADQETAELVDKWNGADIELIRGGASADYLRRTGQVHDLEFILHHQDDLDVVPKLASDGRIVDIAHNRRRHIETA